MSISSTMTELELEQWKSWVLENLAFDGSPQSITSVLISHGFETGEALQLIDDAYVSPQLKLVQKLVQSLKRREWLLTFLDTQYRLNHKYGTRIPRIKTPKLAVFLKKYYYENVPVILKDAVSHWPAMQWTPEMLKERVGSAEIQVQLDRESTPHYERDAAHLRRTMLFSEYVDLVLKTKSSNDFYMTAGNWEKSKHAFATIYEDIGNVADGYLNADHTHDLGFLWLGPKGTLTPLHHDLTNNLFVQVYGRKRYIMIPACQIPYIYNQLHVYSDVDIFNLDYNRFPLMRNATILDFVLKPGDTLFIPNGWLHAVEALDTSISLTFTNFNAENAMHAGFPNGGRY